VRHVTSLDGTKIAYEKTGQGPHLVIVGGALGDYRFYIPLATELARDFTVYNFDRRSRGQSGDTQPYAIERELDDLAALVDDAGEPVLVYGHSAGSAFALRAAAAGLSIAKLVLADPPHGRHGDADDAARARQAEAAATIQPFHDRCDHRGNAAFFMSGFGLPPQAVDELLDSPGGEMMIDSASALPTTTRWSATGSCRTSSRRTSKHPP
jgi:pimeloyl-ACP methyl ester carboxylesterase